GRAERRSGGAAGGRRIVVGAGSGEATRRAASSSEASIPRRESATNDVQTGVKVSQRTQTTPAGLKKALAVVSVPTSPDLPRMWNHPSASTNGGRNSGKR